MLTRIATVVFASLFSTAIGLQDFVGVGTVQCPTQDISDEAPCEFSFTNNLVLCLLDCPDAASFALNSFLDLQEDPFLPCECTQAVNCPDSCTFVAGAGDSTNGSVNEDYVGPGFLECETFSDFVNCDISLIDECTFDPTTCGIQDLTAIFDLISTGRLTVPLLCNCVQATDCPCSFTETEIESNTTSFEGPGTVVCPAEDYFLEPCFPLDTAGLCADTPECLEFDVSPFIFRDGFGEIHIPLPCDCLRVAGCASTCTFLDSVASITRETFEGAGRLTCPLPDYFLSPCVPSGDESCEGTGFECVARALGTLNVTETSVTIEVPCDCVSLQECSSDCSFEPMPETALRLNATGSGSLLCPALDYLFSPCSFEATADDCDCEPSDFLDDTLVDFVVSLPCDCAVAVGCPRSCEFTTEVLTRNSGVADYSGPGKVTCPIDDYEQSPCSVNFFNIFNCFDAPDAEDCLSGVLDPQNIGNITEGDQITLSLPCSCMALFGCPETCTFSESKLEVAPAPPTGSSDMTLAPAIATSTTPAPAMATSTTPAPATTPTTLSSPAPVVTNPSTPSEPTVEDQLTGANDLKGNSGGSIFTIGAVFTSLVCIVLLA